jgi:diacylglycerol kinase family enzyme
VRILLVVNASASSVTARRQVIVAKMLSADHEVEVVETNRRGHATKLAMDAARSGTEVIVTLGGDGTLNEVANGLVGTDCALSALPGGSTNVFARALGLSDDPIEATLATIDALAAGSIRRVGIGSVNGRYFLFHVGVGWDARLVEEVERHSEMKRYIGHALFMYAGVKTFFFTYDRTRPHFSMIHQNGDRIDDGYFAVCLNLNPYTFVGTRPFNLAPEATLDRGLAEICLRSMRTGPFLGLLGAALGSGQRLKKARSLDYRSDLNGLVIEAHDAEVPYQVDGDFLGTIDRLEIVHHPAALNLVVPLP